MARNVEIEARVDNPGRLRVEVEAIADQGPFVLDQEDIFYEVPRGRLKLRRIARLASELIAYEREVGRDPRVSDYVVVAVEDAERLAAALGRALRVRGVVRKRRILYQVGRTRIHLDKVEGLGAYLELEVVLRDGEAAEAGTAEVLGLMKRLGVSAGALEEKAYIDLLEE